MSLLLEARKKSQESPASSGGARRADLELSLEPIASTEQLPATSPAKESARNIGEKLFKAKLPPSSLSRPAINRSLMYGLGGTVALLAAGGGYVWYAISDTNNNQPLRPMSRPMSVTQTIPSQPAASVVVPQNLPVVEAAKNVVSANAIPKITKHTAQKKLPAKHLAQSSRNNDALNTTAVSPAKTVHVEPQSTDSLDPLLNRAYAAYRNGKLDEARQLYLDMLGKDSHNGDALLGLAAIAQQRGEDRIAAQYYLRVLNLDPRNAVANAGMSALSNNENYESRLKTLLREQGNSAALHFALGNLYAEQSRWGEAQQAYFNAYSLDTKNSDLAFNLAVSLDHLGQGKLAAQHYQRALQLDQTRSANLDHAKI